MRYIQWDLPEEWSNKTIPEQQLRELLLRIKKEQKRVLKGGENMLFAVIGSSAGKTRDEIMAIYPRHKAFLDQFLTRDEVVGVGPFTDTGGGNMALFLSRAAAEAFATLDPFFLEGAVREYQIKEWGDTMLS